MLGEGRSEASESGTRGQASLARGLFAAHALPKAEAAGGRRGDREVARRLFAEDVRPALGGDDPGDPDIEVGGHR